MTEQRHGCHEKSVRISRLPAAKNNSRPQKGLVIPGDLSIPALQSLEKTDKSGEIPGKIWKNLEKTEKSIKIYESKNKIRLQEKVQARPPCPWTF